MSKAQYAADGPLPRYPAQGDAAHRLVALGFALQPRLHHDVTGLNRLQVFVVLPCFLLHHLSAADVPIAAVWPTVYFSLLQFALLIAIGWGAATLFRVERSLVPVLAMATVYANVGFFGIPPFSWRFRRSSSSTSP